MHVCADIVSVYMEFKIILHNIFLLKQTLKYVVTSSIVIASKGA